MQRDDTAMVHEGRNVKRIREILGIKQEALAMDLGISQQAVSALEQKEALDREVLEKVAAALKVTPEAIKNFNEENAIYIFSNTYSDHASTIYNNFNPLEKYVEQVEENKKLYEALLKSEREKIALLERVLNERK
jgi:transcriptional regulator with XRE-family HTH domain